MRASIYVTEDVVFLSKASIVELVDGSHEVRWRSKVVPLSACEVRWDRSCITIPGIGCLAITTECAARVGII